MSEQKKLEVEDLKWPLYGSGFVDGNETVAYLSIKFRNSFVDVAAIRKTSAKHKTSFTLLWLGHLRGKIDIITSCSDQSIVLFARARWQEYMEQQYEQAVAFTNSNNSNANILK
jgi:hypothetical protein